MGFLLKNVSPISLSVKYIQSILSHFFFQDIFRVILKKKTQYRLIFDEIRGILLGVGKIQ